MTSTTDWIARLEPHNREATLCVRARNSGGLPTADTVVDIINHPFADPRGDAKTACQAAQAQRRIGLGELLETHRFVAPLRPGKIIGIGRNFRDHAKELGNDVPSEPLLFLKATSALAVSGDGLELPQGFERIDMEAELVAVIGKPGRNLSREQSADHLAALTMGNDISCRDLQKRQPQWVLAKGMDGFAPVGAWLRMVDALPPQGLRVEGWVDQRRVQDAPISDMVFDLQTLLVTISKSMRLECGDMIMTGTPAGVTPLSPGMTSRVRAQGMVLAEVETPVH